MWKASGALYMMNNNSNLLCSISVRILPWRVAAHVALSRFWNRAHPAFLLAFPWHFDTVNIFLCLSFSYKKTSVEEYESRAQSHKLSLSPSQVSTHVGMENHRCSPLSFRRSFDRHRRSHSGSGPSFMKSNSSHTSTTQHSTIGRSIV